MSKAKAQLKIVEEPLFRPLTKSRFKTGTECPTKLFYTRKPTIYGDNNDDDAFLRALADGGFQVGKLAQLGLNKKESADFREYWEPYLNSKPYYFITFMGNQAMDRIAPLNITPRPDTVIRILMDFQPLDKPILVQNFSIKTPTRNGFTVVEWGGVKP